MKTVCCIITVAALGFAGWMAWKQPSCGVQKCCTTENKCCGEKCACSCCK